MPLSLSDLSALEDALSLRLREAEAVVMSPVEVGTTEVRSEAREVLETPDPDAIERLDRIRLFQKLLINIRLNQKLFDDSHLDLRVNQLRAVEQLAQFLAQDGDGKRTGYFKQPTGAGKTVLFGVIVRLLGVRTLVLVPRTNLVDQTVGELTDVVGFGTADIGRVGAGHRELGRNVTVATYQSHLSRMANDAEYRAWAGECELVICDEAHRSLGVRTAESIDALDGESEDAIVEGGEFDDAMTEQEEADENAVIDSLIQSKTKALKLGFTATPRLAGKSVEDRFGTCIAAETHADLVAANILVPYRLVPVDGSVTDLDLEGTFTEEKEAGVLHRNNTYRQLAGQYATALQAYRKRTEETPYPMRGVAFCLNIDECDAFAKEAMNAGLRARVVTGREAKGSKGNEIIRDAERQLMNDEIDLIVTVAKLGEGWNFPPANAAIWARAALSEAVVVQGIGRTARAHFDEASGMKKPFAYVFETQWKLENTNGRRRTRKPLSIADALARNGEDPTKICQNADETPLKYEKPITRERLEELVIKKYTPETWRNLTLIERRNKNFAETCIGLDALGAFFGVAGRPSVINVAFHTLGHAIWGEKYGDPEVLERERVRALIMKKYTPETWRNLKIKDRKGKDFAGTGIGISSIATIFEVENNLNSEEGLHALGHAIWGEAYGDPEAQERERVRGLLMAAYTSEKWKILQMEDLKGKNFASTGMGIIAIASLFSVEGKPIANNAALHALGHAIWGEAYGDPEVEEQERIRGLIFTVFSPETWAQLSQNERKGNNFADTGLGLKAIATVYGIERDPIMHSDAFHELGRRIWPESYGDPVEKQRERVRNLIITVYTPETWAQLSQNERRGSDFAMTGIGLKAIATLFGVKGDPTKSANVFHRLGGEIWPKIYLVPETMDREAIRASIIQKYTPETWVTLSREERFVRNFADTGLGLRAIATLFGIEAGKNPRGNLSLFFELGRKIFGDNDCFNSGKPGSIVKDKM